MPRVSIVLPTYNGSDYIKGSIESVICQTFKDWELIIVNDCSTDETLEIAQAYADIDNRIKIFNNESNQKLPKSLNIGFKHARGELLTWTSDDNMYRPTAIEEMVKYLDDNQSEVMVCCRFDFVDESGEYQNTSEPYSNELMLYRDCVGACFLYRRMVLEDIGEYDVDLFLVEDYEYWIRILFHYGDIGFLDKDLYIYRNQSKSLTATRAKEIRRNTAKMKRMYIYDFVQGLKGNEEALVRLFFELELADLMQSDIVPIFLREAPILNLVDLNEIPDEIIVYGAGNIGKRFADKHGAKIKCFADKNSNLWGESILGKTIVGLDEMKVLSAKNGIVVAAGIENVYSFLLNIDSLGISKCYIYKEGWM